VICSYDTPKIHSHATLFVSKEEREKVQITCHFPCLDVEIESLEGQATTKKWLSYDYHWVEISKKIGKKPNVVWVCCDIYIPFIYPLGKDILTFKNIHHISLLGYKIDMYLFTKNKNVHILKFSK
jgi:hypothetical protein